MVFPPYRLPSWWTMTQAWSRGGRGSIIQNARPPEAQAWNSPQHPRASREPRVGKIDSISR